jgi:hypothetical protein
MLGMKVVMRGLGTIGIVAALVGAMLLATPSVSSAQNLNLKEAQTLNKQVDELYDAGKYLEAIPLAERALSIREKALGAHHPAVATSLNYLAMIYSAGSFSSDRPAPDALGMSASLRSRPNLRTAANRRKVPQPEIPWVFGALRSTSQTP